MAPGRGCPKTEGQKWISGSLEVQVSDDALIEKLCLIRDRVQLEEQSAKSHIIEAGNMEKSGS